MNVSEALSVASPILAASEIPFAYRESASLLCFVLKADRTFLISHPEYQLSETERTSYFAAIDRRAHREPFQYIVGEQEFYGLAFEVSSDVLIPRPETEVLVTAAIDRLRSHRTQRFLEIGIGSGCISVSVLKNLPLASAVAIDISEGAIEVAVRNAAKHGVQERVEFRLGDLYSSVEAGVFDAIVSNPPYVPACDISGLQREVRDYEPHLALTDGGSGVELIEQIVLAAPKHLRPGGFLAVEVGFDQASTVRDMFDGSTWAKIEVIPDLRGIDRVLLAYLH